MARHPFQQLTMYDGSASIRVIIVEHRAHVRKEIRELLVQESEVEIAGSARLPEEALPLIRARQPHVVLMETGYPDDRGIQICREIRTQFPGTKIIVLAARADQNMMRHAMSAGCHGYLADPLSSVHIVSAIRAVARDRVYFEGITGLSMKEEPKG